MKKYYKVVLGRGSIYADDCINNGYIGVDFDVKQDLTNDLPDNWRDFNKKFIPIMQEIDPNKSKIGAGLWCGQLWTISKGIEIGDIVLSPISKGSSVYKLGEVTGN
jgi:restriction system protein